MNKNRGVIPEISLERIRLIMKKTLSIVLALAMVFAFMVPAFATTDESTTGEVIDTPLNPDETVKPTDPAELGAYYAALLNAEGSDPAAVVSEMLADLDTGDGEGLYTLTDLPVVLEAFEAGVEDENADKLAAAFVQIEQGLADMGIIIPDTTLPDVTLPDVTLPDATLPDDEGDGETDGSNFLNTILGILGSIGDMIFGGGSSDGSGDDSGDGEDTDEDLGTDTDDDLISDTGDTTVFSVAAVALVAGAALVLTRKKSDDAE